MLHDLIRVHCIDLNCRFGNVLSDALLFFRNVIRVCGTFLKGGIGECGWVEGRRREGCKVILQNEATSIFQHQCYTNGFFPFATILIHSNKIVEYKV